MNNPNLQNDIFNWAQTHDFSFIVNFHNEVKRNFQNEIVWINEKLEEDDSLSQHEKNDLRAKKKLYLETFEPYLRVNTFLMMVSHLEEWLWHIWKRHAPRTGLLESKGSIGRFKPVLKAAGVDLSHSDSWRFIKGCQDIRSCLLHANGRLSLNRNPDKIHRFVDQYGDIIKIESDRLVLDGKFLTCFQDAAEKLIESVKFEKPRND